MDPWQKQNAGSQTRPVTDSNSVVTDRKIQNVKGKNFNMDIETVSDPGKAGGTCNGPSVETIISHKLELVECLRADRSFILQHVYTKQIVTDRQYQRLKHISQPEESVNELIDQVIVRGQESCSLFLEVLKEPGILQTYPQLKLITEKW
ncbi:hypothetical protein FQN60_009280 [Etheostoma spectabile]|uniref:CARD domain-containing protein n=1 Tax=Etheostoma spectabile TaxID=54343 RepID=A0A5J5DIG0_9PERO|nr:hypothetical protein FQN60_009280 [Etheostoma spectabile]